MKVDVPSEAAEAKVLMQYMNMRGLKFTHVKNETGRPLRSGRVKNWKAVWDKIDGVSPGFPDFIVLGNGNAACIELKRKVGGKTSEHQLAWVTELVHSGIPSKVCKGADEAIEFLELTLGLSKTSRIDTTSEPNSIF